MIPGAVMQWRGLAGMGRAFAFEPSLVLALIWRESTGNKWAYNPEPPYRYLWDVRQNKRFRKLTAVEEASEVPPADFYSLNLDIVPRDAEWWGQQESWGLIQVMGAVARERNFKGMFLTELCDPETCLQIGLLHLKRQFDSTGNTRDALRRYNGGPNNPDYRYADDVLKKYAEIESEIRPQ